jgi:putative membrane protein
MVLGSISARRLHAVMLGGLLTVLATGRSVAAEGSVDLLALCLATLPGVRPDGIWREWSLAPAIVVPMLLLVGLYLRGLAEQRTAGERPQPTLTRNACFAAGIGCLIVAVMSPLCRMASTLAWAHMVQHVLLVVGAPLLLALSRPGGMLLAGLPQALRKGVAARISAVEAGMQPHAYLIVSFLLYGINIWFWHIPALYEGALLGAGVHLIMYASLLTVSLMFWHATLETLRLPGAASGTAAILLFFTFLHTAVLGLFLTLSPRILYPLMASRSASWGLVPLDDQRLAGLIMWIPMGSVYATLALAILGRLITTPGQFTGAKAPSAPSSRPG